MLDRETSSRYDHLGGNFFISVEDEGSELTHEEFLIEKVVRGV